MRPMLARFSKLKESFVSAKAKREYIESQMILTDKKTVEKSEMLLVREKSIEILKKLIDTFYEKSTKKIEKVVSLGLQEVFPDRLLRIRTELENRRGKTNLDIITVDEEQGVEGRADRSFGGAIVQVQSFLLLVTFILLLKLKPITFLDEQFSNVSAGYQPYIGKMISKLCKQLGISVCLITHNEEILEYADIVYHASLKNGELVLARK